MGGDDPARQHLEVYDTKAGLWHPELGELAQPDGWDFLPRGDAFLTRHVKASGAYWVLFRPKARRAHRRQLGLLAPAESIAAARAEAEATAVRREVQRTAGARQREKSEAEYRSDLEQAALKWLDFAPEHAALAADIARHAAHRAAVVGSGRVGRTKLLSVEERAVLAVRAHIRHHFTEYEDRLMELVDVSDYSAVKREAHGDVDEFLAHHRTR